MKFRDIVPNISTMQDKKRIASAYVVDYRNLSEAALEDALKVAAPQYSNEEYVRKSLDELLFHADRDIRILHKIILKTILLNQDDFLISQVDLDEGVIDLEQEIVNASTEELEYKSKDKNRSIELFRYVLEAAWDRNGDISPDEKNLIEKIKARLRVTDREYQILEANLGKFPKDKNEIHLRDDIRKCRHELQSAGLLMCFRTSDKVDYDIIAEETAATLRKVWGIEIKSHGYRALVGYKAVRSKQYFMDILEKAGIEYDKYASLEEFQDLIVEHVSPSYLLGGFSPRDGLDAADLSKWCRELALNTSGQKSDLIDRVISYYDGLKATASVAGPGADERALYFEFFEQLARRDLNELRRQGVISKDIDCERSFEKATYYLLERYLGHKPLQLTGTEHPDGILAYKDRLILWDNKSKETSVNLKDHIKQFDRYIKSSQKPIAAFIVIGPDFSEESNREARAYRIQNDVPISLLKASDLKQIAIRYESQVSEDPFPLANFIQDGIVDISAAVY